MALIDRPLVAPERTTSGFRPLKVWHHFRKLVADKEDTEQVFHIIEATKGKASHRQAWDFIASPQGQRFLREDGNLPAMLDDHARWAELRAQFCGGALYRLHEARGPVGGWAGGRKPQVAAR